MLRKMISIDESLCDGCGLCVPSCHEGALQIIDGKARLVSDRYCDGLGACLGHCPRGAITIEEREADPFTGPNEAVVGKAHAPAVAMPSARQEHATRPAHLERPSEPMRTALSQWPIQLRLVPPSAQWLEGADLLICADCVPFALPDFHARFLQGRKLLVGCPKLDDYEEMKARLLHIIAKARPRTISVLRMEVPCCGGIARAVQEAVAELELEIPLELHTIGVEGQVMKQGAPIRRCCS